MPLLICKVTANYARRKKENHAGSPFFVDKASCPQHFYIPLRRYNFIQQFYKIRIRKIHYIIIALSEYMLTKYLKYAKNTFCSYFI